MFSDVTILLDLICHPKHKNFLRKNQRWFEKERCGISFM